MTKASISLTGIEDTPSYKSRTKWSAENVRSVSMLNIENGEAFIPNMRR